MAYLNFISNLSHALSQRFMELIPKPSATSTIISIKGLRGTTKLRVDDICFSIPKQRFQEIITAVSSVNQDSSFTERVWKELDSGKGTSMLELMMNDCFRKGGSLYDIQFYTLDQGVVFNIRVEAPSMTQKPTTYQPIFYGPFDCIQEVEQGQYAIKCAQDSKPILTSWHFASCVGFAAFDAHHQIGIVAHIDEGVDFASFNQNISGQFNGTSGCYNFEYVLFGGCENGDLLQTVNTNILALNNEGLQFFHTGNKGAAISQIEVGYDSFWIASVRLSRSVALDTRKSSFAEALLSYEPFLNPDSSLHKRKNTHEEADAFAAQRGLNPSLTGVISD